MALTDKKAEPLSPSQTLAELARTGGGDGGKVAAVKATGAVIPLLFVRVGKRWFGVHSESVREVATKGFVTRVPTAPAYVLGVTLVRGRLVPVLALEGLLGSVGAGDTAQTLPRLVVLRHGDTEIALVADETRGVIEQTVAAGTEVARSAERARYLGAEFEWEGKLVCMLDVPTLIADATPQESDEP
jgi:purine-binding chemotaxis protein CheW